MTFLIQTLVINSLIDYLKKPTKKNFKALNLFNCLLILCDSLGFLYVIAELIILYLLGKRKKIYLKLNMRLIAFSFISFLIVFPILLVQYAIQTKLIIPTNFEGIRLNLNSIYLMLSEYVSPYLSFYAPETQTKSTLGLLYGFFVNPDFKNINTIKIIITLFYSSILPLLIIIYMSFRSYFKNYKLKLICLISLINFGLVLILMLFEKVEVQPINTIPIFITSLILLGYGIFTIKDKFIKFILISCIITIQIINPELSAFDITIYKNHPSITAIKNFIKEYYITSEDILIIPHNGKYISRYIKNQNVFNYDDTYLLVSKKNSMIRNLASKKAKRITKKNIQYLTKNYLKENKINNYIMTYFLDKTFQKEITPKRYILVIDKLNSKPISQNSIKKCANIENYSPKLRKIDFRYVDLAQNQPKILFDALSSKTTYNILGILNLHFELEAIAQYKKIENEYYKVDSHDDIYKAISSYDSDYAFLIFK